MNRASDIEELRSWPDPPMLHVASIKKAVRVAWKRKFGCHCPSCAVMMHFEIKFRTHKHYATIDHIVARGLGGTNSLTNIQVICRSCNNIKSANEHLEDQG